jgi:HAD superfamily hydrolase (TIGR01509 family)
MREVPSIPPIDGVIFDMDGLLLDTERLAMRGLAAAAEVIGIDAPEDFCHSMIGIPVDGCRRLVKERFGDDFPADRFLDEAARQLEVLIEAGHLTLKPAALDIVGGLEALGIPKAIATSSSRAKAERHLQKVGLLGRFDAIVTRDDVARGKPHPDVFLRAARAIGQVPGRCLALEDSYNGVRAAAAAGLTVIMVPDLLPATDEARALCAAVAPDLGAVFEIIAAAADDLATAKRAAR